MLPINSENCSHYPQLLQQQQLGLQDQDGQFRAVPVSLTPWRLSRELWQQVLNYSQLLSRLLWAVSRDMSWMTSQLSSLTTANLLSELIALPQAFSQISQAVPIMRHDFLLDCHGQWRWVESNTIAAGMGPLNQQLVQLLSRDYPRLAPNPAISEQAVALYQAAMALRQRFQGNSVVIVFVVEPEEDNIFDQQLLQRALQDYGAKVLRLTLYQLTQTRVNSFNRLQLGGGDEVDLLYYRTGYNRSDYNSTAELNLRSKFQQVALVQCPDLPLQLAGSKWIQAGLSQLLLSCDPLLLRWGLNHTGIKQLRKVVMPLIPLSQLQPAKVQAYINNGWILKSQHEGGGSVWCGADARKQLSKLDDSLVLMAPVDSYIRTETVQLLRHGSLFSQQATVSELGIFSVGTNHHYGGYLLRSKAAGQLAGGIHRGGAVLDTVIISDNMALTPASNQQPFGYDGRVAS